MRGKYLITTDNWFIAPDTKQYKSVWGNVVALEDTFLGIKTNRNSSNWFLQVGSDTNHVIIAGCQIHYAVRSDKTPNCEPVEDWQADSTNFHTFQAPTKIYIAE